MFGSRYKRLYHQEMTKRISIETQHENLIKQWNSLVDTINKNGGKEFLDGKVSKIKNQFSQDELKTILTLCHPDKHNSSTKATEITKRINQLRT